MVTCPVCQHPAREDLDASFRASGFRPTLAALPQGLTRRQAWAHWEGRHHLGESAPPPSRPSPAPPPPRDEHHADPAAALQPAAVTFRARVDVVREKLLSRQWGPRSVREHAQRWGVSLETVRRYVSAAASQIALDRGELDAQRERSILETTRIRDDAIGAEQFAAALAAQRHLDQLLGVLTATPAVVIQQQHAADFRELWGRVMRALEGYDPRAAEVARAELRAIMREKAGDR